MKQNWSRDPTLSRFPTNPGVVAMLTDEPQGRPIVFVGVIDRGWIELVKSRAPAAAAMPLASDFEYPLPSKWFDVAQGIAPRRRARSRLGAWPTISRNRVSFAALPGRCRHDRC